MEVLLAFMRYSLPRRSPGAKLVPAGNKKADYSSFVNACICHLDQSMDEVAVLGEYLYYGRCQLHAAKPPR